MSKIFIHRYKALHSLHVAQRISRILEDEGEPLTDKQKEALGRGLGDSYTSMPFQAYEWKREEKEGKNTFWRLSIVAFIPVAIVILLFLPIHWLFTGRWTYDVQSNFMTKSFTKWYQNIFE